MQTRVSIRWCSGGARHRWRFRALCPSHLAFYKALDVLVLPVIQSINYRQSAEICQTDNNDYVKSNLNLVVPEVF